MSVFRRRGSSSGPVHNGPSSEGCRALPAGVIRRAGVRLISVGVPALDDLFGGGLPVGTVCLVDSDSLAAAASHVLQLYISQGTVHGHPLVLASAETCPEKLLASCPCFELPAEDNSNSSGDLQTPVSLEDQLSIAWRYRGMPRKHSNLPSKQSAIIASPAKSQTGAPYCGSFDFSKTLASTLPEAYRDASTFIELGHAEPFNTILTGIQAAITECAAKTLSLDGTKWPPLRIAIHDFCSPMWGHQQNQMNDLVFFQRLRAILHDSNAVALVTVSHAYQRSRIAVRAMIDFGISFESFDSSAEHGNGSTGRYHGLVHVHKAVAQAAVAGAQCLLLSATAKRHSLAFKIGRRHFVIEKWHLPPSLGREDVPKNTPGAPEANSSGFASCASTNLDF